VASGTPTRISAIVGSPGNLESFMGEFQNREEGFERGFVVEEEVAFKSLARRNKLIGLWLAQLIGRAGAEADSYASAMVAAQVGASDEALFDTIRRALGQAKVEMSDNRIRRKMAETTAEARAAIVAGR
jgi:hypothetical protein